jgi:transcription antitermination factor NusG
MLFKAFRKGWYVIYTRPKHEKKVANTLSVTGVTNFLPTVKVQRTWADRKKFIDVPLFPSYLFVYLEDISRYYEGLQVEGVIYFVRQGTQIATISEDIIDTIRVATLSGKEVEVSTDHFQTGDRTVINNGPFTGLSCEVVEYKGRNRILVRVNLLQRNILVNLESENLLAISA